MQNLNNILEVNRKTEVSMLLAQNVEYLSLWINSQFPKVLMNFLWYLLCTSKELVCSLFGDDYDHDQAYWSYYSTLMTWKNKNQNNTY